jgi:hypothetical protein
MRRVNILTNISISASLVGLDYICKLHLKDIIVDNSMSYTTFLCP